jgi:hemerythrin-like domain-containing protein
MEFIDFRLPAEGFAQPLMLWAACHQRGQRVALLLQRLFAHLRQHRPNDATRVTSAEVRRYLHEAAPRHHKDEDVDLFPRLRRRLDAAGDGIADAGQALLALDRLERDHPVIDDLWIQVRAALVHADKAMPTAAHCACADEFVDAFITHHTIEDQVIMRAAAAALQPQDMAEIGEAMARRRGTTWAALSAGNGDRR